MRIDRARVLALSLASLAAFRGCAPAEARLPPAPTAEPPHPVAPDAPDAPAAAVDAPLPTQIKDAHELVVRGEPAAFTLGPAAIAIDGREIPLTAYPGAPVEEIARAITRVPAALRAVLTAIEVSATPSPNDAAWTKRYGLPVLAGMSTAPSGKVTIFPHGIDELTNPDHDVFVRNLFHELGHAWSLHDWKESPAAGVAWIAAIKSDRGAPSKYALSSFRKSGLPFEDVAEATALYFLTRGTPAFAAHREAMPARFALLDARFPLGRP
jgi:hypothetical protein